jgi:hypothetical protein
MPPERSRLTHCRPKGKLGYCPVTPSPPGYLGRSGLGAQAGLPFLTSPSTALLRPQSGAPDQSARARDRHGTTRGGAVGSLSGTGLAILVQCL